MKAAIAVTLLAASLQADVASLAGDSGVVLALDATGNSLAEAHRDRTFTPASTLKVVTTWLAAETMGLDVRFETDFYLDGDWLIVRGKGDPGLVSEEVDLAAKALVPLLPGKVLAGVAVDDSFFVDGIEIPGVTRSSEPYDALNSATAVNFNTINVTVDGSTVTSAEAQTPLIPLAVEVAKARGVRGTNRINIGDDVHKARRYAAELFAPGNQAQDLGGDLEGV
jgi:D-alanyl-D-alanine carboxypeptidase/D-alanyl-D-alanine-endopeptidase (penicillin-binding protein 4)